MKNKLIYCLVFILLFSVAGITQTKRKSSSKKSNSSLKTLEGVVIGSTGGPKWIGIVIKSGNTEYVVSINNAVFPKDDPKTTGSVEKVGTKVRVTYKSAEPWIDNRIALTAIRVDAINQLSNSKQNVPSKPLSAPHIIPAHREVLQKWLVGKPNWRPATINDVLYGLDKNNKEFVKYAMQEQGRNYHPYYVTDDFNQDKKQDFAVIIITNDRKRFALAIFNAPFKDSPTYYTEKIGKGDWMFWKKNDGFGRRFIIGPPSSDAGYLIKPRGNSYYIQ